MKAAKPDYFAILRTLRKHKADFIVIGGVSGVLHGAPITTLDLDIVHKRTDDNIPRLLAALHELDAHFRYHPKRISPNPSHLTGPGHSLLTTSAGPIDVLGVVDVVDMDFDQLLEHCIEMTFEGEPLRVLSLEMLIEIKEKLGRPKDLMAVAVLKHTLNERTAKDEEDAT